MGSIVLALAISLAAGGAVTLLRARHSVLVELRTALEGARETAADAIQSAPAPGRLVALFRSDRHVEAVMLDARGTVTASSHSGGAVAHSPGWFQAMLRPVLQPVRLPTGPDAVLELRPAPANEIDEVWTHVQDAALFLLIFAASGFVLVQLTLTRTLKPLEQVSEAFGRIGEGRYDAHVEPQASTEVRRLAQGFNAMAARLGEMQARNRGLEEQLLVLQEEERADLARDLHDEIGPYLFAVNMDADAILRSARAGKVEAVAEPAQAIRGAVGHIQQHVRDMLRRLKPARAVELGLEPAMRELVRFWSERRPAIAFNLDVALGDETLDDPIREGLYRVAQEAVSNAVRHGSPRRIDIALASSAKGEAVLTVEDDGHGGESASSSGFGLAGMRERMAALGGALEAGPCAAGRGWRVAARAPVLTREPA